MSDDIQCPNCGSAVHPYRQRCLECDYIMDYAERMKEARKKANDPNMTSEEFIAQTPEDLRGNTSKP